MASVTLGTKAVTTSGTPVALSSSSLRVASVAVQCKTGNTGLIYLGDSTVTSTRCMQLGIPSANLTPPSISLGTGTDADIIDLADVYIDCSVSGEGVNFLYFAL